MTFDIKRGEIFYISRGGVTCGSEQYADRPAVIISNDSNNKNSNTVEIVYLTTQPKTDLPTHCTIRSTGKPSTVLCEQVHSVSVDRIGNYIGQCSENEMENINICLMISLALDMGTKTTKQYTDMISEQQSEIDSLKAEIESLKGKQTEMDNDTVLRSEFIRIKAECDTYKNMYENLLEKIMKA